MKKKKIKKVQKIMNKIIKNISNNSEVDRSLKGRLNSILIESEYLVSEIRKEDYFGNKRAIANSKIAKFRPLMEKIVDVIGIINGGADYYEYLEILSEHFIIEKKRNFLNSKDLNAIELDDKSRFHRRRVKKYSERHTDFEQKKIERYKFDIFIYGIKNLCKDSTLVIHDDNAIYKDFNEDIINKILKDIENIVLFFVSEICISLYNLKKMKKKKFLKEINKKMKEKVFKDGLIKIKNTRNTKEKYKAL